MRMKVAQKAPARTPEKPKAAFVKLDADQMDLLERLKAVRAALARQQGVPAFVIFSDKTLREMAALLPRSRQELMNVSGIGDYKADKYGSAFLEVIREFLG